MGLSTAESVGIILIAMVGIAAIECFVPLRPRGPWSRIHLVPNIALTTGTFATNAVMNIALGAALICCQQHKVGMLGGIDLSPASRLAIVIIALDFSTYVAHVALHKIPFFWRFHRVHHSDPAVDVTTSLRQHPGEGIIRYAFLAVSTIALGASPAAFASYRGLSAINALFEHANLRAPAWLDYALSLVTTWPHMHKVHHSRIQAETDTNYGNLFSAFDRLFGTFTPSQRGVSVDYGLEGYDAAAAQTTAALLALPFGQGSADETLAAASGERSRRIECVAMPDK